MAFFQGLTKHKQHDENDGFAGPSDSDGDDGRADDDYDDDDDDDDDDEIQLRS